MSKKFLIVIVGPTAIGKTSLSISLAEAFQSEIISADSRQFFKEMEIGTAKPSDSELQAVPHHFINSHSIHDSYDAGMFEKEVLDLLAHKFNERTIMFLAGGSGLYVNAVCEGLDEFPEIDPKVREGLNARLTEGGLMPLLKELQEADPVYYDKVDRNNPQRVVRALEIARSTGRPFSSFQKSKNQSRPFEIIKIGLEMDREALYQRIDLRMDRMIESGLFEEARRLVDYQHLNALQTVGYKEIFDFFNGKYSKTEAVRLLKRNSRRYAKRQMTWFKRSADITWFHPSQEMEIKTHIHQRISELSEPK